MIKIEINAETGSEARSAFLELLGLTGQLTATVSASDLKITDRVILVDDPKPEATTEQAKEFVAETIKKRRTNAEIEAEKFAAQNGIAAEDSGDKAPEETKPAEETKEETTDAATVTVDDLKKKAVELGRVGKRELCRAVLQKFDAESISTPDKTPLKPEHYAAVLDEFNKL